MKREHSDTDEDFGDDEKPGSPSSSVTILNRKRRRGTIEKRRRDRINTSLNELRRLVPAAFEKQGSAKLEKAEILQYTVEHLRNLHQRGLNGCNGLDPMSIATDYRQVGFRECASEVGRYLVAQEGLDVHDPLRQRLISHLQCFAVQKDASSMKASTPAAAMTSSAAHSWNGLQQHTTASYPALQFAPPHPPPTATGLSSSPVGLHHNNAPQSDLLNSIDSKFCSAIPPLSASSSQPPAHLTALANAAQFNTLGMGSTFSPATSYSHSGAAGLAASSLATYRPWAAAASAF